MSDTRQRQKSPAGRQVTGWVGWIAFAATMLFIVGSFNIIDGLVALAKDEVFVNTDRTVLLFDLTTWGWIHLVLGILQVAVAAALLKGAVWGQLVAIVLVTLNAVAQLTFLGAYPLWATIVIAFDVVTLWALVVHGDEIRSV